MGRLRVVPNSVVATLFPAFSEREASDDRESLQRLYLGGVRYLFLFVLPCFAYLVVLGPDLLTLWIGSDFAHQSTEVLRILAAGLLLNTLANIPWAALQGLGRPDLTGKIQLLELPFYVLICCALIPRLGAPGAAIAASLRFGVDAVILFWAAQKYVGCHLHLRMLRRLLLPVCLLFVCLATNVYVLSASNVRLDVGIGVLVIYALAVWKYSLDGRDKPLIAKALNLLGQPARS
jgi:O-antigen/teichoic acid export membrane protein